MSSAPGGGVLGVAAPERPPEQPPPPTPPALDSWHAGTAAAVTGDSASADPVTGERLEAPPGAAHHVVREEYASEVVDDLLGDVMLDFGL